MPPTSTQTQPISFFQSHIAPEAIELVNEVLRSGWVNEGEMVKRFERSLSSTLGMRHPVTVNSGTASLHLALALANVGPGDEVILPAQTFMATGLAILMQRATPIFADIDPYTGNIAPDSIESKITSRTRAVMPVHWGGYTCDLDEINTIAEQHNLTVIEDAAHALGATYRGQVVGNISRFTAFSFQAIKHLTTGDGGMLCCASEEDAKQAVIGRWFGIDRANMQKTLEGARGCDVSTLGYKYHMNNIAAAVGLGNLIDFPSRLARRREIGAFYRAQLNNIAGIELLQSAPDREHAYWLFTLLVERREDFARKLAAQGIPCSVVDFGIDRNSVFGVTRHNLPGQDEFDARQISLPVHEGLSDADIHHIVETIRSGW